MTMKKMAGILLVLILVSGIAGCAVGNKGTLHYNRTTTIGQELPDLQAAKDKGALSEDEYNKIRADIMRSGSFKVGCLSGGMGKCGKGKCSMGKCSMGKGGMGKGGKGKCDKSKCGKGKCGKK